MKEEIDFDKHTLASPPNSLYQGAVDSSHRLGQRAQLIKEQLSSRLYDLVGAKVEDELLFLPGPGALSEALFLSAASHLSQTGRGHILTTGTEEAHLTGILDRLEPFGCRAGSLPLLKNGQVDLPLLREKIGPRTGLVSLSWASPLTGVIQPIYEIGKICEEKGVPLHVDATHVMGKLFWQLSDFPIDFLSLDGGRLYAPRNSAALFCKQTAPFLVKSWSYHPLDLDAFSLFTKGCEKLLSEFEELCMETARLRERFEQGICEAIPGSNVLFASAERLPNVSALYFPRIVAEALLFTLSEKGLFASRGGGQMPRIDHLLRLLGEKEEVCLGSLSFALCSATTEAEVGRAILLIKESVERLQKVSSALFEESIDG